MRVLYVTSEAYPFCKTGGLADVAGSLPPALARSGVDGGGDPAAVRQDRGAVAAADDVPPVYLRGSGLEARSTAACSRWSGRA